MHDISAKVSLATLLWTGTAGVLLAQADVPMSEQPPTTVVGALIAVTLSMVGGYWYIIKRLFETVNELRIMVEGNHRVFTTSITELQSGYSASLDKLIEDRAADRADSAERRANDTKTMLALARQNAKVTAHRIEADEDTPPG